MMGMRPAFWAKGKALQAISETETNLRNERRENCNLQPAAAKAKASIPVCKDCQERGLDDHYLHSCGWRI